jgi:hypothetical protein
MESGVFDVCVSFGLVICHHVSMLSVVAGRADEELVAKGQGT